MIALLITGTDIDVGKTWIGRALAGALTAAGRRVVAIKPVETGCGDATAIEEDGALLAAATGQTAPQESLHRFAAPVAPALAAEAEGATVDLDALILQLERLGEGADVMLIEGPGGLLSPITWEWTVVELARALGASALVVGMDRRGVINHAQLTLSALELAGIPVMGLVLTTPESPDATTGSNASAIARLGGIARVATMPRMHDPMGAGAHVAEVLGWMASGPTGPALGSPSSP